MVSFNATAPLPNGPSSNDGPKLNKARHVTYWKRCLKTYLPPQYASMDANRMMVVYFTFLSLDLLSALDLSEDERENALNWIYLCQHHDGGFRGSPGVDLDGRESEGNREWDVATVPATFFALGSLAILRDDFSRVKRKECLTWLRKVQRSDGSFGEHLGEGGVVEGGMDTRFGMCAAGVRWFLRGDAAGEVEGVPDVEVDKLIGCIRLAQTFDGGISEMPFHEPHGGYTYCALAALSLIGGLPSSLQPGSPSSSHRPSGISDPAYTTRWLLSRQTAQLYDEGQEEDATSDDGDTTTDETNLPRWAGFNGRCNKTSDTCYSFWIPASLSLLSSLHLSNTHLSRAYLLEKTQHVVGGFGKKVGDPPDVYHSALGLAALGLVDEEGVEKVDARLCLGVGAVGWVEGLGWRRAILARAKEGGGGG